MATAKATYPRGSTFDDRISNMTSAKERVAKYIVDQFLGDGQSAVMTDGSSCFYVGLELFQRDAQVTVFTNNLAIAHEFPLWGSKQQPLRSEVFLAGGEVDRDLTMAFGDSTEEVMKEWADRAQTVVVSVRAVFADRGPAGMEFHSLKIKHAVLETARRVIFVADHEKLSSGYDRKVPLVYHRAQDWEKVRSDPNVFLISTPHPDVNADERLQHFFNPANGKQWFLHNTRLLRTSMGNRYVEV